VASTKITESEWLQELAALSRKDDEGFTAQEWADKIGKGINTTRAMLRMAYAAGWLHEGKRTMRALGGRTYNTEVYRIVKPK
jgi:hypothetical protein